MWRGLSVQYNKLHALEDYIETALTILLNQSFVYCNNFVVNTLYVYALLLPMLYYAFYYALASYYDYATIIRQFLASQL